MLPSFGKRRHAVLSARVSRALVGVLELVVTMIVAVVDLFRLVVPELVPCAEGLVIREVVALVSTKPVWKG